MRLVGGGILGGRGGHGGVRGRGTGGHRGRNECEGSRGCVCARWIGDVRTSVATGPLRDTGGRSFRKVGVEPMDLFYQQLSYPTLHCCVTHDRTVREEKHI